jgi:hypothetical protein
MSELSASHCTARRLARVYRVQRPGDHGIRHGGPATIKLVNLDLPALAA